MPNQQHRVLGIGAALIDIIAYIDDSLLGQIELAKGSVSCTDPEEFSRLKRSVNAAATHTPGGSCANVIRALNALGWPCTITGKVGDDEEGRWLMREFHKSNISTHFLLSTQSTGQVLCLVTPDGERTMVDALGATAEMRGRDLNPQLFENIYLTHIEGYSLFNENLTVSAMSLAKEAHTAISFDLANFKIVEIHRDIIESLLRNYTDLVFANEDEARTLTQKGAWEACQTLMKWCKCAVVTLGKEGCLIGNRDEVRHFPAEPIAKVIDTTGAGDLFAAGFLHEWMQDNSLEKCAKRGATLAAAVIQREGAFLDCLKEQRD